MIDKSRTLSLKAWFIENKSKAILATLVVFMLFGFTLRVWDLGSPSLWIDEGFSINAALATIEHGYPKLDSGEVYNSSTLNTYFIAGSIKIFGFDPLNPFSARIPSIFFGTGVILLVYLLSRKIFKNETVALLTTLIIALSFWEIEWSRQARGYAQLQFFILATLLYFWEWLETSRIKYLIISVFTGIGALLSHIFGIVLIPIAIIALIANKILHPERKAGGMPLLLFLSVVSVGVAIVAVPKRDTNTLRERNTHRDMQKETHTL